MPVLTPPRKERFCQLIASGTPAMKAYGAAGYKPDPRGGNVFRLRHRPEIETRIGELLGRQRELDQLATERAIERLALTKEALARELVPLAVSNLGDYIEFNQDNDPYFDLSKATRAQLAAVQSLQIESYADGKGAAAREVKKIKLQLHPKIHAAMGIARMFGWVVQKHEDVSPLEERLRAMTPEQRAADADELHRKVRQMLLEDQRAREAEAEAEAEEDGGPA